MIIYITEPDEIDDEAKRMLTEHGHTIVREGTADVEVLFLRTYTTADKALLDGFPKLRYILRAGVGTDSIDTEECKKRAIAIINAPGSNANAVAEYVMGLMILLARNVFEQMKRLEEGGWRARETMGYEIRGKVIGILGCGAIGKSVAEKVQAFSPSWILGYDPYVSREIMAENHITKTELPDIIANADIITLHLPLIPETHNLITLDMLKRMKKSSYILNTSRGGILREEDLVEAVKTGIIAGAALDVFESEPKIGDNVRGIPNLILSPHIAGLSREADKAMSVQPVKEFLLVTGT